MVGKKEGWMKDGTKADNGICIKKNNNKKKVGQN